MNQHSDQTVRYYDEHAEEYVCGTVGVPMDSLYQPFLEFVPVGGTILDAGCGSGRDTKAFLDRGFEVVAIDASQQMVEATICLTGRPALQLRFQEMCFESLFDGVWACASLLHVTRVQMDDVLNRIERALRPGGVCYMSFKEGEGDRVVDNRNFTDFTATSLKDLLAGHARFDTVQIWTTADLRRNRNERWVNVLVRKGETY